METPLATPEPPGFVKPHRGSLGARGFPRNPLWGGANGISGWLALSLLREHRLTNDQI